MSRCILLSKRGDPRATEAATTIAKHLSENYTFELYGDPDDRPLIQNMRRFDGSTLDFAVTIGGDGTVLRLNRLLNKDCDPIVVPFGLGHLGFLLPFNINDHQAVLKSAVSDNPQVITRDRLKISIDDHTLLVTALNEINVHRGASPRLARLACSVDNCQLTGEAVLDGLLVATGTGSTAYSLSAGGPIVHPSSNAILLTPVCPRSLSFRPVVLSGSSLVAISSLQGESNDELEVAVDGESVARLSPGQTVSVQRANRPLRVLSGGPGEWAHRINTLLGFNRPFGNSP